MDSSSLSRADHSAVTRRLLVDRAQHLFATRGYAATSLDDIVADAHLTKGALYHHFTSKRELFSAVFYQVEAQTTRRIEEAIGRHEEPATRTAVGLRAFLEICREDPFRRVIVEDGPSVLGAEIHDVERRSAFDTVVRLTRQTFDPTLQRDEAFVRTLSRILYAAMTSAGALIAFSSEPEAEIERAELAIQLILRSLRRTGEPHS